MNRNYNLKLDLQFRCNNSIMKFNQFDNNTSDFFIKISSGGKSFDVEKAIVVLATIKPSGKVSSQFVEVENGLVYADLKPNMKDEIGTYTAQAMLILEDERVVTDTINYEVNESKILSAFIEDAGNQEDYTLLTDMLNRLSTIEISEEQRMINEAERILSEENRKIEEAKRVETELIRQHEEADRAKYDAIRESNENIRKQNESIRLANETNRIDEESKRVEEENKRKLAEDERNANYNFMTEDEERRRSEANAHKEAEVLRVQAETNRVNEEAKRRTTEQARVSAENTRVGNENTRKANETTRQTNETKRVEAETQRQNRYNSFITDAEANANNFENYTNTAKVKEEERKSNELDRKSQEDRRVSNENERISNENSRKANEEIRESNETSRQNIFENKVDEVDKKIIEINTTKDNFVSSINTKVDTKISELDNAKSDMTTTVSNKVNEVETRFNALTSSQQQSSEVIDARDGETSLKARLDRDIEKAKQVYVNVEGSHISTDSSVGYAKDVEIKGNTIQDASNLADIRSVGDTVEGQELYEIPVLSRGKNLITKLLYGNVSSEGNLLDNMGKQRVRTDFIEVDCKKEYRITNHSINNFANYVIRFAYDKDKKLLNNGGWNTYYYNNIQSFPEGTKYLIYEFTNEMPSVSDINIDDLAIQLEVGRQATPYEPYQEDKLTILSPVQLEKVGDVADRIICKDGVWGVEKNVVTKYFNGSDSWTYDVNLKRFNTNLTDSVSQAFGRLYSNEYYWDNDSKLDKTAMIHLKTLYIHEFAISDRNEFNKYLVDNGIFIKYPTDTPQFIPLPHDQQVKLRTFANKTNISFLTEIEGTIKAQVPKSLGATVNTHTEQISNLNKELDRVKKLEESTVSTVTTESDFTTVEATNGGYFEDVKLEGKTLVNLNNQTYSIANAGKIYNIITSKNLEVGKEYTVILNANLNDVTGTIEIRQVKSNGVKLESYLSSGLNIYKINIDTDTINLAFRTNSTYSGEVVISNMIILEGDYTQNPPAYFEGLKSVGDGADEIVVSSVKGDGNLLNVNGTIAWTYGGTPTIQGNVITNAWGWGYKMYLAKGVYTVSANRVTYSGSTRKFFVRLYDVKRGTIVSSIGVGIEGYIYSNFTIETDGYYVVRFDNQELDNRTIVSDLQIIKGDTPKPYTPHQSDKKRLLYYNEETQAWEKPILRQWDSIEKHADGKYYYHQRSGEVVLNSSENWSIQSGGTLTNSLLFQASIVNSVIETDGYISPKLLCDKFNIKNHANTYVIDEEAIANVQNLSAIRIRINKSKLTTQDVQGFKQWLQANNVTVVYQLAQEKVYECTNIDLITYANETNYIVECGAIVPRSTLKVHNNISNVVSLLQKKVSLLESNVKASQEVQDMMILETDMRMLDIELALMEFIPMKLNLGGSDMLRSATYFNFLKNHIINETYEKEYLENVMNKYLATGRINQDEYNELYKMLYPPVYDIELPIEY